MSVLQASEVIRTKRDGQVLSPAQIAHFVQGLADGGWSDAQCGAMAMAVLLNGMSPAETVALTEAMTHSGTVLDWAGDALPGPILDKHSTGGVGDKVSLPLAPIVAACGGVVPMVSGRGLGHTGGTLDKLEALPGYTIAQPRERLLAVLRQTGCAIVGASADIAPADRRLYAIRDVTATVESVPLITASILSKKRAAGLQALLLDVKVGSGAFAPTPERAQELAQSLVRVSRGAGLPARALITDMQQVLGRTAGNALEVAESINLLKGEPVCPRLRAVTLGLSAELLQLGGLFATVELALGVCERVLASGEAAERIARKVAALGGPADVLADARLATAPVQRAVPALRPGFVAQMDVRALGLAVVALGGGRLRNGDAVDPRVGLAEVVRLGTPLRAGEPLAVVHAASAEAAEAAVRAVQAAMTLADAAPAVPGWLHATVNG